MKITAVVVLYNMEVNYSRTFKSLIDLFEKKPEFANEISLIVYDNSKDSQSLRADSYAFSLEYKHDPRNLGIATAYNYALQSALEEGREWLLLLDHDTELTDEYLDEVISKAKEESNDFVAIVPRITSEGIMISPVFSSSLRPLQGGTPEVGLQESPVMAINSGALLKVSFLRDIKGFNNEFPLDYLDHWLFFEIYSRGYKITLLHSILEHELSVMDYSRVSLGRYKSIIDSEKHFYKKYKSELYPQYRLQLFKRFLKQLLTVRNKKIAGYTLRQLFSE